MRNSPAASLLVGALVMLRQPCTRNKATAQLLLERAAEQAELTPAEREACLNLAAELDGEHPEPSATHITQAVSCPVADKGRERRANLVSTLPFPHDLEGSIA